MQETGLSLREAAELAEQGKTNSTKRNAGKSVPAIIASNIFTYFNGIFFFLAALVVDDLDVLIGDEGHIVLLRPVDTAHEEIGRASCRERE